MNDYDKIKTPCFFINKEELDYNIENINKGRCFFDKSIIGYSVKTNSLLWLLKYLYEKTDFYLEVVSPEEYIYVLNMGISPQRIIFNGPCKNIEILKYALYNNSIVNIDTYSDIKIIENIDFDISIGIRVNVTYNDIENNIEKFGYEESRFGFSYYNGDLEKIILKLCNNKHIKINGLHFHLNNKKREIENYKIIANLASEIINKNKLNLEYIDFGGGYKGGHTINFSDYTSVIYNNLEIPNKDDITYIFEPGASLIATPISYLTRVIDIKEINDKKYILIDGGRTHTDPTMSNKKYKYNIISNNNNMENKKQIVTGFSCMENDRILEISNDRELSIGDIIELKNLGAYTMTFTPLFIKGYPIVYLQDNKKFIIVRDEIEITNVLGENYGRIYKKIKWIY